MIETLILILKAVGLICLISLAVVVTLSIIVWIIWSIILLILSIFPKISIFFAKQMGFQSTSNFILCLFVFVSYIMLFFQNIKISELKEKNKEIIQKTSIYVYNQKNKEKKEEKE